MTLQRASGAEFSFVHSSEVLATNSRLIRALEKPENLEGGIDIMGINLTTNLVARDEAVCLEDHTDVGPVVHEQLCHHVWANKE